jgi:hypothetical protein
MFQSIAVWNGLHWLRWLGIFNLRTSREQTSWFNRTLNNPMFPEALSLKTI